MIPIKNPNISTNRYKELLQIEKYYKKYKKDYQNEIEENIKLKDNNYELEDKIYILEEGIESIIYQIEHNPRPSAENRDKYIIKQLNDLLNGGKNVTANKDL